MSTIVDVRRLKVKYAFPIFNSDFNTNGVYKSNSFNLVTECGKDEIYSSEDQYGGTKT